MKTVSGPRPKRLALLTWAAAWPLITVLLLVLNPVIGHWPLLVRTFLLSGAMAGGLFFVLLPPLRQRFHGWLHAEL